MNKKRLFIMLERISSPHNSSSTMHIHWRMSGKRSKMNGRKSRSLTVATILLVLAGSAGIVSAALYVGLVPGFRYGAYVHSPTATYSGYFSVNYVGLYHYVHAVPVCRTAFLPCPANDEALFFLNAQNGTVRLVFYCGRIVKYYCESSSELSFSDGACLHVKGTLIQPSRWPDGQFSPSMHFIGDLYVFEQETLPERSCST
jgi:hypothetical protein